jgi:hypothetical protein
MKARILYGSLVMMLVLAGTVNASAIGEIQKYFSDAATKVKATNNASEKRVILDESFHTIIKALDAVESLPSISKDDRTGINRFKVSLQEKQDELLGRNGYVRVSDDQLNAFSDYVVQDMEQADGILTAGVVILLFIIALVVFLVK